jgi:hypothetical protein
LSNISYKNEEIKEVDPNMMPKTLILFKGQHKFVGVKKP